MVCPMPADGGLGVTVEVQTRWAPDNAQLVAAHLAGGLRVLALEFLPWRNWQKALLALAAGCTIVAGAAFALSLV